MLEEILNISNTTPHHLQDERTGPCISQPYKQLGSEKSGTDVYIIFVMADAWSPFRDFGSYLRFVFGLDEDNIQVFLKQ